MSLFDRYLFREWLKAMFVFVLLILGILVLEDMYKNLKMFLGKNAGVSNILGYYLFLLPSFFYTVIPVSFFVSLLFVLNTMQGNNEIIAMRAAGLTVFRITRVLWLTTIFLAFIMGTLNAYILPLGSARVKTILERIEFNDQKNKGYNVQSIGIVPYLNFYHLKENRLWFMSNFSFYSYRGKYAVVSQLDNAQREQKRIQAAEVSFDDARKEWVFYNGRQWNFDVSTGEPQSCHQFQEIRVQNFTETPKLMNSTNKQLKHLSFGELKDMLKEFPKNHTQLVGHWVKYYSILSTPFICFMVILLAIPFSLKGVRTNPMVGVSEAVGLFFLYYLVNNIGQLLGTQGLLQPFLAAWLPNILMLGLGGLFYRQLSPR